MAKIDTWDGLENVIYSIVIDALNEVGEYVASKMRFFIDKNIYSAYDPKDYDRTSDFLHSVVVDSPKRVRNEARVKVHHDTSKLELDEENFLHGSEFWSPTDIREYLPEILAFNGSGNLFGVNQPWHKRSNYWYDTLDALQKNGELTKVLKQALKKRGLVVK
jgi:hypothetical protein